MRKSITAPSTEACRAHLEVIAYDTYLQLEQILAGNDALDVDDRATLFAQLVAQQAEQGGCLPAPHGRKAASRLRRRGP